jgi:hypothetical protein
VTSTGAHLSPENAAAEGWRYHAPAVPPETSDGAVDEIERLRTHLRAIVEHPPTGWLNVKTLKALARKALSRRPDHVG